MNESHRARRRWTWGVTGIATALGVGLSLGDPGHAEAPAGFTEVVDAQGRIRLPEDFRRNLVHLGSWFVPGGEASGFHDVYTQASTVEAYRETGRFPDGATLVKELRPHRAASYTTGANVAHATADVKQWFVMVKDGRGRFEGSPNWGEGWGWALFKPDAPMKNVSSDYRADCLGCHLPARATDWVYVEGYPTLGR